ncbi:flavodoxin family protein [Vallitalea pronyensis]|uniref:Flavodoxin family protein n=1 Tax=Vallitalea pronyensis TaxID=1348613 RepID=A0A8J8MMM5_9FIRM|nr:flavodoxin family protein [Vallitalea pronyensis]QUI24247.1 flavodoxin family protein [Vallitalea pronyensis]
MGKKVIAINSSKRKKNTYGLLIELKEQLKPLDIHMDIIHLHDYSIKACAGCEACIMTDRCPIQDDSQKLMKKLLTYDGIVIGSPVYMNQVSGMLKNFFDRTCKWAHRPALYGVPMLFVISTAGSGIKATSKYLKNVALQWGAFPTDTIGRKVSTMDKKIVPEEYNKFLQHLAMPMEHYRPSFGQIIYFSVYKALALKLLDIDRNYWVEKGWHQKAYFFDSRLHPLKKLFGHLFFKRLYRKINKV